MSNHRDVFNQANHTQREIDRYKVCGRVI